MIKRSERISVRFSDKEKKQIWEQAAASVYTPSEFIRRCALGRQIVSRADLRILAEKTRILNELRKLGGLLKHIHLETQGAYSQDTASAIQALEAYAGEQERELKSDLADSNSR
jgi:hypothetical protein